MGRRVIDELLPQVRRNCLISDAEFWGYYSTCGLLLRLREQYRFEAGLPPGAQVDIRKVGAWIEEREAEWQRLEGKPLCRLEVNGKDYDPYDVDGIGSLIEPEGYIYGGGHGVYMKPVFFLAELRNKRMTGEYSTLIAGRELVRDLSIHPAMSREGVIVARSEVAHAMLRDRFDEYRASRRQGMLCLAFEAYGIGPETREESIRDAADSELDSFIHHEYGELKESERLGSDWTDLVDALGTSRTGLQLRGVKDALADTTGNGMLSHIINKQKSGSLYFYVSSLTGIRYTLATHVVHAVKDFTGANDWNIIEMARKNSYNAAQAVAEECLSVYRTSLEGGLLEEALKAVLLRACPLNS